MALWSAAHEPSTPHPMAHPRQPPHYRPGDWNDFNGKLLVVFLGRSLLWGYKMNVQLCECCICGESFPDSELYEVNGVAYDVPLACYECWLVNNIIEPPIDEDDE
jgi:hypothetical protein